MVVGFNTVVQEIVLQYDLDDRANSSVRKHNSIQRGCFLPVNLFHNIRNKYEMATFTKQKKAYPDTIEELVRVHKEDCEVKDDLSDQQRPVNFLV